MYNAEMTGASGSIFAYSLNHFFCPLSFSLSHSYAHEASGKFKILQKQPYGIALFRRVNCIFVVLVFRHCCACCYLLLLFHSFSVSWRKMEEAKHKKRKKAKKGNFVIFNHFFRRQLLLVLLLARLFKKKKSKEKIIIGNFCRATESRSAP